MGAPAIDSYAIVGDCRSAALVSTEGAVDFLCWPRFDSPSLFAAMLDPSAGGTWSIAPLTRRRVERRYVDDTNVLETRFVCDGGEAVLTDLMCVCDDEVKKRVAVPEHELLRRVECTHGEVEVEVIFDPRPSFGLETARIRDRGTLGVYVETGEGLAVLRADVPLTARASGGLQARFRLKKGESRVFALAFTTEAPAVLPLLGDAAHERIEATCAWWRRWSARAKYEGPHRDTVVRSALALKLLAYAPSGAILAAPTTSLPERPGGDLNWDYRFCWLRDASFTARALTGLGFVDEAEAFVDWLVHTTALSRPRLHVLYDVFGTKPIDEQELWHLSGYRGAKPVRVGNGARDQLQLDVYGEVIEAATQLVQVTKCLDRETERMLVAFGDYVCSHWSKPDQGIWEPREDPKPHTNSRLLCWAACDRLMQLHDHGVVRRAPVDKLRQSRDAIRREIETRAWNESLGTYVGVLDSDVLDATTLLLPWYGFDRADSARMRSTFRVVKEKLSARDGLLYRYLADPPEGAFGICSFWASEYLAIGGGTLQEAESLFTRLLDYANDVGLFAEEIDPHSGSALGNFPQAFTHVGVLNTALSIEARRRGDETRDLPGGPWHGDRPSYARAPAEEARA